MGASSSRRPPSPLQDIEEEEEGEEDKNVIYSCVPDVPKSGGDAYLSKFIFLLEKFYHFRVFFFFFFFLEMPVVLGFTYLEFIQVQFLHPSLWTRYTYSCLYWLFITKGFLDSGCLPLVFMNEFLFPFSFFI